LLRENSMLNHVTIGVSDLERSKAFHDKALKAIGIERLYSEGAEFFLLDRSETVGHYWRPRGFCGSGSRCRRPLLRSGCRRARARQRQARASVQPSSVLLRGICPQLRTATTFRPFAAILRDRAVRN
jgi:catechol 2,3-dioxygenase-like lactoylglutathione lyase family enzyme